MNKNVKQFFYYLIPAELAESGKQTKAFLYGLIFSLSSKEGYCWASNSFLAEKLNKSPATIKRAMRELKDDRWIETKVDRINGNKRKIWIDPRVISDPSLGQKQAKGSGQKRPISNINKSNIKRVIKKKNKSLTLYEKKLKERTIKEKDPEQFQLARLLYQLIKEKNPAWHVKPNWNNWANDIRLLNEADKRSWEQIEFMIRWCHQDPFWQNIILSPSNLRKKFNQLCVQAKGREKKVGFVS